MNTVQIHTKKQSTHRRFFDQQVLSADSPGYCWLALGTLLSLFAVHSRWELSLAAWLGPLFLLRFTRTSSTLLGFGGALLASVIVMFFWLYESLLLKDPGSVITCLIFSIILTLPYLLDRLISPQLRPVSELLATLIFPLSRAAFEYLISFIPLGSLFSLATTQYGNLPLLQIISITGVYGVSFLMAWFASVGNWIWEQHVSWPRIRKVTLLYGGLLVLILLGGNIRLSFFAPSAQVVRVAGISAVSSARHQLPSRKQMVQMALTNPSQLSSVWRAYDNALLALSRTEAHAGAKIIVWPEVGGFTLAKDKASLIERAQALARQERIYLDMGLAVFQPPAIYYNQAILIDQEGRVVWTYNKTHPAPGDPEGPGAGIVPTVNTPYGRLANVICFDADFPALMQQAGNKSVDLMLVPSDDWQEIDPWHTQQITFQAIENGYSIVRQTSNGLSMAVDYQGRVLATSDYFTTDQQTLVAFVPVKGTQTIYALVGDLFTWLCLAGLLLLTGSAIFTARARAT